VDESFESGKGDGARGVDEMGGGTVPPSTTSSSTDAAESILRVVIGLAAKPVKLQM